LFTSSRPMLHYIFLQAINAFLDVPNMLIMHWSHSLGWIMAKSVMRSNM
jgi:hypothetical protein